MYTLYMPGSDLLQGAKDMQELGERLWLDCLGQTQHINLAPLLPSDLLSGLSTCHSALIPKMNFISISHSLLQSQFPIIYYPVLELFDSKELKDWRVAWIIKGP